MTESKLLKSESAKRPSQKMPTLSDVARLAGVSRWVAGSVLNGGEGNSRCSAATVERILKSSRDVGYRPNHAARLLRGKRSHTFGLLVAAAGDPLRSFLVQFLDAEVVKIGCNTLIGNTVVAPGRFEQCVEDFAQRGVDGVFCAVHHWFDVNRAWLVEQIPNTVFYEDPQIPDAAYVTVNRSEAMKEAVKYLVEQGRSRIGLAVMTLSRSVDQARMLGYETQLKQCNRPVEPELVFNGEPFGLIAAKYDRNTHQWKFPHKAMDAVISALVDEQKVDAIIAHDDFWAAALIPRLRARGIRVPEDVAVIGYLNHYLADWTEPRLTTFDLQHDVAASHMVSMLEEMATTGTLPPEHRVVTIEPKLIVRESA